MYSRRAMELTDGTVTLRPWRAEDAGGPRACQDPEIPRWIPMIPRPYELEDARAFVRGRAGLGPYQFAIEVDGQPVGSIGMRVDAGSATGHIGYWCAAAARGRGVVTRRPGPALPLRVRRAARSPGSS